MNHEPCQSLNLGNILLMKLLDDRILWGLSESNRGSKKDGEHCVMRRFIICTLTICRAAKLREGHVGQRGGGKCK
jgi:hypothetical protein